MKQDRTMVDLSKVNLETKIRFESKILTLGSCFADEFSKKLSHYKYQTTANPFGTVFNPLSISSLIKQSLTGQTTTRVVAYDGYYFCYDCHSSVYAETKDGIVELFQNLCAQFQREVTEASHLIITLGSAWFYVLKETGEIVSNCHKKPGSHFEKRLLTVEEMTHALENSLSLVKETNPSIELMLTVSPVRHTKDGLFENNLSKGRLLDLVYQLQKKLPTIKYLPVYELVVDELRDYSFFNDDLIHPNQKAVNHVWERTKPILFDEQEMAWQKHYDEIRNGLNHRPMLPKAPSFAKHLSFLSDKMQQAPFKERFDSEWQEFEELNKASK